VCVHQRYGVVHLLTKNLFSCVVPSFYGVVGCANNAMRNHDKSYHKIPSERDERARIQKQRSERQAWIRELHQAGIVQNQNTGFTFTT
jgi:uncharacterized protein (DUF2225 family)